MVASSSCPSCGGRPESLPAPGPSGADTITYEQAADLIYLLTPPDLLTPIRLSQANGDLTAGVAFAPPGVPLPNTRFFVLRNYSLTGALSYWFNTSTGVGAKNQPTRAYNTLPAAASATSPSQIAIDAAPASILLFYPSATTDGLVELLIGSMSDNMP